MHTTVNQLTESRWTGILASDEAPHTMARRHSLLGLPTPTWEQTRIWREVLYTAPAIERHLAGLILFGEDVGQCTTNGTPFVEVLAARQIVVGVNGDTERVPVGGGSRERVTKGMETLATRLAKYRRHGARFAKWRAEYLISDRTPSAELMAMHAASLARFAAISQEQSVVPLLEPDILWQGGHSLADCRNLAARVLDGIFAAMSAESIDLRLCLLKLAMITPGADGPRCSPEEVGQATADVLGNSVPPELPLVALLSGGQSADLANARLAAIVSQCRARGLPQKVTFSFGRSLQLDAMRTWQLGQGSRIATQAELVAGLARATLALGRNNERFLPLAP